MQHYGLLFACPTPPESLAFPTYWYRLPTDDRFLICTKCYEDKLRATPFASWLRYDYLDFGPGGTATCDFNTPRIDALLRHAIASTDFQPLRSFAEQRLSIKSCSGTQGIKGGNGEKWFKPMNDAVPHFICCEACYEDIVLGTNFAPHFVPYGEQQPSDQTWSCDLAVPYLKQSLQRRAQVEDWQGFVEACRHRMSLPTCERGVSAYASAKRWYNTVRPLPIHDMTVCEACYLDCAGWREEVAQNFAPIAFRPFELMHRMTCDFNMIAMSPCIDILLPRGLFEKWHYFASLIMSKPGCSKEGVVDGEWYGLPDPNDPTQNIKDFDICVACHAGWNQSADWGHLFRRLNYPPGTSRLCDFHPSAARYSEYVEKWNQMYFTRDATPFIDYVSRLAGLPQCQLSRRIENATWYGDKDASLLICPSCFEQAVHGTYFASAFPLQNTLLPDAHHCSLYSFRMRGKYAQACEQRSMDSLLSFAVEREQVYQKAVPQIEAFLTNNQQKFELLQLARQQRQNLKSIIAVGNGFMGGKPIITNYDPAVVLSTINIQNQHMRIQYDPQRPAVMQLEALWKEVE